jgi:hypothetical protein
MDGRSMASPRSPLEAPSMSSQAWILIWMASPRTDPTRVGDPNLGGGRSRAQKIADYFNSVAFAVPAAGTPYGNSPRNPLIGPGYVNTDISAFKRFVIYEKSDLLFRAEVFNAFNNVNLGTPNATLGSTQYGKIASANTPRIMQFALKYEL